MGVIINIDEALEQRSKYNVLKEPLHEMLRSNQEAWEKKNPIDLFFNRGTLDSFQMTYTSSIGFDHAFTETSDYAVGPIFNTAEGFAKTYTSRTFQGGFIITQQVLEDGQFVKVKDDANAFMKRWHGDIVEYAMSAIQSGFGNPVYWAGGDGHETRLLMTSADTADGDIHNPVQNPLFYYQHTVVRRKGMKDADIAAAYQSNIFNAYIDLTGNDAGKISKLADVINQVITIMENYKDDNGKIAGVQGSKVIVAANDAHLKAAINTALASEQFCQGEVMFLNPAYQSATAEYSPYLGLIDACKDGAGFFIIDRAYNGENHGPEFTERIPLTLEAFNHREAPQGIKYEGRQRFDVNVASWRGVAYVNIEDISNLDASDWKYGISFTAITPNETIVKPVSVVGTVITDDAQ